MKRPTSVWLRLRRDDLEALLNPVFEEEDVSDLSE